MFRRASLILLNPFIQALLMAVLIILFIPLGLKKYKVDQVALSTHFDDTQFYYADLDHDGISERIHTFLNLAGNAGVVVKTNLGPDQQRNFKGVYKEQSSRFMIGDYDSDNLEEIFLFTYHYDSILLHAIKFGKEPELFIANRFITTLGKNLMEPDFTIVPGKVSDMTGDGVGDLTFGVNTGFSKYPRKIFIYDIVNDSVFSSPNSGAYFNQIIMADIDRDLFDEIALFTSATDNFNEEQMVFHDSSSWMMVLDHDLDFLFPPKEFHGVTGNFLAYPVITREQRPVLICIYKGFTNNRPVSLALTIDTQGNTLFEREVKSNDVLINIHVIARNIKGYPTDRVIGFNENDGVYEIDTWLNFKKISDIKYSGLPPDFIDIDGDGKDEFIVLSKDFKTHYIFRNDFTHPAEINFPVQEAQPVLSIKMNGQQPQQLSVQGDDQWWLFDYGLNPVYRLRFLIYLAIYLSILAFILLIRNLYAIQLKRKYETEKKIAALQLSSIKTQMEPHFVFNVINSIGSSIYREKKDEAYLLVVRFSNMVRSLLSSSDQLYRTLHDEVEFVTNYLELERQRFPELYNFKIDIAEDVDRESFVPKMILQLHAENALKHGLRPKGLDGMIWISISRQDDYLRLLIRDNGIGRQAAAGIMSQSTGKGMKMLEQLFDTYNKHNPKPIIQTITDLSDEHGLPAGTLVEVLVPLEFNAEIY